MKDEILREQSGLTKFEDTKTVSEDPGLYPNKTKIKIAQPSRLYTKELARFTYLHTGFEQQKISLQHVYNVSKLM